jgi:hypothetical protein
MKALCRLLVMGLLPVIFSCNDELKPGIEIFSNTYDFAEDLHGFVPGFSDYPAGSDDSIYYQLKYDYADQAGIGKSIMLSGNNRENGLFMFLKKKLTGLQPNTEYTITFNVDFASNAQIGVAGYPAENVLMKVGATDIEPKRVIENDHFIMNIDKGEQGQNGVDMIIIGDISIPSGNNGYINVSRSNSSFTDNPLEVKSNNRGELWLIVGTDSAYKGITTVYYTSISVVLSAPN